MDVVLSPAQARRVPVFSRNLAEVAVVAPPARRDARERGRRRGRGAVGNPRGWPRRATGSLRGWDGSSRVETLHGRRRARGRDARRRLRLRRHHLPRSLLQVPLLLQRRAKPALELLEQTRRLSRRLQRRLRSLAHRTVRAAALSGCRSPRGRLRPRLLQLLRPRGDGVFVQQLPSVFRVVEGYSRGVFRAFTPPLLLRQHVPNVAEFIRERLAFPPFLRHLVTRLVRRGHRRRRRRSSLLKRVHHGMRLNAPRRRHRSRAHGLRRVERRHAARRPAHRSHHHHHHSVGTFRSFRSFRSFGSFRSFSRRFSRLPRRRRLSRRSKLLHVSHPVPHVL
mmetsp:Transcript_1964/g.8860  ORF Transcript_1964/g.8860 Transcript_1964/m.8860 type:complete len:336 (+) Transcript_1964:420-1427(+)